MWTFCHTIVWWTDAANIFGNGLLLVDNDLLIVLFSPQLTRDGQFS